MRNISVHESGDSPPRIKNVIFHSSYSLYKNVPVTVIY